jgi:hypothetical protein
LIITRNDKQKRQSYRLDELGEKGRWIRGCGDWTVSRFPVVMIGHYNTPCLFFTSGREVESKPPERDLVVAAHFIEFTDDDGERLRISW